MPGTLCLVALLRPTAAIAQSQQIRSTPAAASAKPENAALTAPSIQVWSTETRIEWPLLQLIPFESRFAFASILIAPGVNPNNSSAYGSGGETSHAYLLDGATMNDPETGATWVFANYNWIQDVQIDGLAANAEYGGFTGVAAHVKLRSGTNDLRGMFETLFQND